MSCQLLFEGKSSCSLPPCHKRPQHTHTHTSPLLLGVGSACPTSLLNAGRGRLRRARPRLVETLHLRSRPRSFIFLGGQGASRLPRPPKAAGNHRLRAALLCTCLPRCAPQPGINQCMHHPRSFSHTLCLTWRSWALTLFEPHTAVPWLRRRRAALHPINAPTARLHPHFQDTYV